TRRSPPRRRRRALRGDAAAAAGRPRPRPPPEAGPPRRADGRSRPADPRRDLDADRGLAGGGDDDPDVDPLHRGGGAARRRGRADGPGPGDRPRPPRRADRRARRPADGRVLRAAGAAGGGPVGRRGGGAAGPVGRPGAGDRRLRAGARRARSRRRDHAAELARGRLRQPHRGGARMRRIEPAAVLGVMSREVANFRTFWRSTTFSSLIEPMIYLLAFGLGLGTTLVSG